MTQSSTTPPMVSVVMITYNQQHCIDSAISGVLHQRTTFPIELIVANDASTDDTLTHVLAWQRRYPDNVVVINHKENVGFRANYLSAVRRARGRYMCMCDADDYWTDPTKLARQVRYMEEHPECAITFHRVINLYDPSGRKTLSNGSQATDTDITHLSRSNYITNLSVMYRRTLVPPEEIPGWIAEAGLPDYAYHMLYAAKGTIHYFRRPMGLYRQSASGEWSLNGERHRLSMALDVRSRLMKHFGPEHQAYPGLRDASADILTALLDLARKAHDEKEAERITQQLRELIPHITTHDIETRLLQRNITLSHKAAKPIWQRILRRSWHLITTLLPTPRPC
ncbi:MAG: glycosyltransferase [Muribaculaceae bacterium]|nr:glycosyltransferase [Muribaculaceae bacterium]